MQWMRRIGLALAVIFAVGLFGMVAVAEAPMGQAPKGIQAAGRGITMVATGQKTGLIRGPGKDNTIPVLFYSHSIVSPRDPQSGLPTGQRMHKPFVVRKEIDKSSPLFANVLCTNENLTKVELRFYNQAGINTYMIKLTNANIASLDQKLDPDGMPFEEIAFTYQKIEWTWLDGNITSMDDWEARN